MFEHEPPKNPEIAGYPELVELELDPDTRIRLAAFERVRRLQQMQGTLTARDLAEGLDFDGARLLLPGRVKDHPDRDRLALRFERFQAGA